MSVVDRSSRATCSRQSVRYRIGDRAQHLPEPGVQLRPGHHGGSGQVGDGPFAAGSACSAARAGFRTGSCNAAIQPRSRAGAEARCSRSTSISSSSGRRTGTASGPGATCRPAPARRPRWRAASLRRAPPEAGPRRPAGRRAARGSNSTSSLCRNPQTMSVWLPPAPCRMNGIWRHGGAGMMSESGTLSASAIPPMRCWSP